MGTIAGIVGRIPEGTEKVLSTMSGPADLKQGAYFGDGCCLMQKSREDAAYPDDSFPLRLSLAGEQYTAVYCGALYNAGEIRKELRELGHALKSESDLEMLLHAYIQWGDQCLGKLNGVFTFAVWEQKKHRLFAARDPMGVKPFFYKEDGDRFLFGSQIKNILGFPGVKAELDEEGIAQLVMLGPGRIPGSGVFYGIRELEPGCCGWYQNGKWNWKRYWKLSDREHRENMAETVEHVRFLVEDSVSRQMKAKAGVGTFLSGGLDSSMISAICAGEMKERGDTLSTFSLDFKNNNIYFTPGKFQPSWDTEYIKIMEDYLHSNHHWLILDAEQQVAALERAVLARDLPGMGDVDASMLLACGEIGKQVPIALSGECADEIFGGYPWYRDPAIRNAAGFPWAQNTESRKVFLNPDALKNTDPGEFVQEQYERTIRESDILPGTDPTEKRMKQMVNLNMRWFMQTLLDRTDRMSYAGGLEVRMPFCDVRIAEYLYGVPWEYKDFQGREKGLLRKAANGLLPEAVLYRKKSPYPKTYDPRYMELMEEKLRLLLQEKNAPIFSIIKRKALETLLTEQTDTPWYGQLMKRPQTIAYMLQLNFWMGAYRIRIR